MSSALASWSASLMPQTGQGASSRVVRVLRVARVVRALTGVSRKDSGQCYPLLHPERPDHPEHIFSAVDGFFLISELTGTARDIVRAAQEKIDRRLANTSVPHVTITGSSGVGPIPLNTPEKELEAALRPIAETTAPIVARLGPPMRFMQTDIIVLPLDPHGPLRRLHERIARSGLPFQRARFPFTPHATLSFYVTLDPAQRRELLSVRVDEPVVIDRVQCYRTVDPLPARKVLEFELTGARASAT